MFIDLINANFLLQHVTEPTRQNNILNLVITNPDLRIIGLEVTDKIGDHRMIDFVLQVHDPKARTHLKISLSHKHANFELKKEEFSSFDYKVLMRTKTAKNAS
ncbi:hypothetical protein FHG87_001970 [Trinorchestia longiramus]|nr:hypothetical protein FHG87_001970 [Trinorchestia longiramus]